MPMQPLSVLAIKFFKTFARFEYALKEAGFHNIRDGDAKADWQSFARSIENQLANPRTCELQAAIDYLINNPPKKQVIQNGRLGWTDALPSTNSNADLVLTYVRRVRNNLFHGGKFKKGHWSPPDRSQQLLHHSLVILEACLEASPGVLGIYYTP